MQMESQILQVNIDDIIPNRFQPRLAFDDQGLKELSASIKEHGIIQPLVLRKLGSKYEIIAGERRYKAATMAGLTTVPAVISNIDDNSSAEIALVENIQRRDLTPIEEARSYKNLLDKGYLTQEQLAKKMGISQSAIANKLRLLNLDDSVQQALLDGKISERHARSLLTVDSKIEQKDWLDKIITNRMTVRQLDEELKKLNKNDALGGDIPLVSINPDFESIKNNSFDINPTNTNNVANMMVPDDILTDYSESLPTSTIDAINSTPFKEEPSTINRFFNILEDTPANMNSNDAFAKESNFSISDEKAPIFDFLQPIGSQDNNMDKKEFEVIGNERLDENISNSISSPYDELDLSAPVVELNPNNKFFTPAPEDNKFTNSYESLSSSHPKEEQLFDPMNLLDSFDNTNETLDTNTGIMDDISEIKDLISKLQSKGLNISYNESETPLEYKINITIDK